jgi:hypothetical protein
MRLDGHIIQRTYPSKLKFRQEWKLFRGGTVLGRWIGPAISGNFHATWAAYLARILSFK